MGRLKQWPPALLRRWLFQAASGLGCLAVGSTVFLAVGDSVLLSLSVLLALLPGIPPTCSSLPDGYPASPVSGTGGFRGYVQPERTG